MNTDSQRSGSGGFATTEHSSVFDLWFHLPRIPTTAHGWSVIDELLSLDCSIDWPIGP